MGRGVGRRGWMLEEKSEKHSSKRMEDVGKGKGKGGSVLPKVWRMLDVGKGEAFFQKDGGCWMLEKKRDEGCWNRGSNSSKRMEDVGKGKGKRRSNSSKRMEDVGKGEAILPKG